MKLQDINERVAELRSRRDDIHTMLHELMADKEITVSKREESEKAIRDQIREINDECYPLEYVRGKANKIVRGIALVEEEKAEYERLVEEIGGIEIG